MIVFIFMNKVKKNKLKKSITKSITDYNPEVDSLVIDELIHWLEITEFINQQLEDEVKNNNDLNWQTLTKKSMASKQIIAIAKSLNITVADRMKGKDKKEEKTVFDLNRFLNEN
jgi:hypothetical protein